nr:response regulator [Waterburya agarophytonicola]
MLVEDDRTSAAVLSQYLTSQHYLVDLAHDGQAGWHLAEAFDYELIILDVMLPQLDGISFCQQLRAKEDPTPVMMLTAYDSSSDKITGLDAGADDYVVKPYDLDELLARIRALLRRGKVALSPTITWGDLCLDPSICEVTYQGQLLRLTAKEYAILELFLRNTHRIFSQSALLDRLWSFDEPPSENTVRAHIKSLRRKLKEVGATDLIETVYGLGYRLREISPATETLGSKSVKSAPIYSELMPFWQQSYQKYSDRLATLEKAVTALETNSLSASEQHQAARQAHTLIGSLGSFGLEDAARLCREIEQILQGKIEPSQITPLQTLLQQLRASLTAVAPVTSTPDSVDISIEPEESNPQLLIIDDDRELNLLLIAEAKTQGIQAKSVTNISAAREMIARSQPDIILLDLCFPDSKENGLTLLQQLAIERACMPVVVFTASSSFSDRLKATQWRAQSFLQKPTSAPKVIDVILQILQQSTTPEASLLIVDDDPQMLDLLNNLLSPWGFKLTFLEDPQQFWQTLQQTTPDLLILDIAMPNVSGIELCQVVRNDPDWSQLPILFLSAHQDADTVNQVFMAGGDDYVNKPIVGAELIARILNRLERTKMLRQLGNRVNES